MIVGEPIKFQVDPFVLYANWLVTPLVMKDAVPAKRAAIDARERDLPFVAESEN